MNNNVALALQTVLSCLMVCQQFGFSQLYVACLQSFCDFHLELGDLNRAWETLEEIFSLMGNCSLRIQGDVFITCSKYWIQKHFQNGGGLQISDRSKKKKDLILFVFSRQYFEQSH